MISGSQNRRRAAGTQGSTLELEPLERRLLLSAVTWTKISPSGVEYVFHGHEVTPRELRAMRRSVGVAPEGDYAFATVEGHGTGARAPTTEEWDRIGDNLVVLDSVETTTTQGGEELGQSPSAVDWTTSQYFPPIGSQDGEGSCTSWAVSYYTKTFQEAQEHGWDLSGATWEGGYDGQPSASYQDRIFSPDFTYHLINSGHDGGSWVGHAVDIINRIGNATWATMPYDPGDSTSWPSETAWREAPPYRGDGISLQAMDVRSDISNLKDLLASGNLAQILIDSDDMYEMATLDNFENANINHCQTIVGYDDTVTYMEANEERSGAFKVANSWGSTWSKEENGDGCWWISYEALKDEVGTAYSFGDQSEYEPHTVISFQMDHAARGDTELRVGTGEPDTSTDLKTFDFPWLSGNGDDPYPASNVVLDVSELPLDSTTTFFMKIHDQGTDHTGTLQSFSVESYRDYNGGELQETWSSSDPPTDTEEDLWVVGATLSADYPDLAPTVTAATPDHVLDGKTDLTYSIENQGAGSAGAFEVNVVLSRDSEIGNGDDTIADTVQISGIAAGATASGTVSLQLDKSLLYEWALEDDPPGEDSGYESTSAEWIGLVVDPTDQLVEPDEQDNLSQTKGVGKDDVTYFPWDIDDNYGITPTDTVYFTNRLGKTSDQLMQEEGSAKADADGNGGVTPTERVAAINRLGYIGNESVVETGTGVTGDTVASQEETQSSTTSGDTSLQQRISAVELLAERRTRATMRSIRIETQRTDGIIGAFGGGLGRFFSTDARDLLNLPTAKREFDYPEPLPVWESENGFGRIALGILRAKRGSNTSLFDIFRR